MNVIEVRLKPDAKPGTRSYRHGPNGTLVGVYMKHGVRYFVEEDLVTDDYIRAAPIPVIKAPKEPPVVEELSEEEDLGDDIKETPKKAQKKASKKR